MATRAFFRIVAKSRAGDGALVSFHGRFNSSDSPPTSYVADELETAWAEVSARFGASPPDPQRFLALRVEIDEDEAQWFDLASAPEASHLLSDPAPPAAQDFAARLRGESSFGGIRYESLRRPRHECVVLFLEKIGDVAAIELDASTLWAVVDRGRTGS